MGVFVKLAAFQRSSYPDVQPIDGAVISLRVGPGSASD
jgi:hypothetical protein